MKCQFCGKNIDEIDCSCKMCTICGWSFDVKTATPQTEKKEDSK